MRNILIAVLLFPLFATAFTITNQYIIPANQQVEDEQWILATVAQPDGIFLNDLSIMCANPLFLPGTYEGNVNGIAGMETVLSGTAKRNVRITGKVVRIEGFIEGNLMILADTVTISEKASIGGTVRLIADKAIMEGTIGEDLHVTAGTLLTLDGTITGNAHIQAREILADERLRVHGDFSYQSDQVLFIESAQVDGTILKEEAGTAVSPFSPAQLKSRGLWLFAAFLVGVLYLLLFPGQAAHATHLIFSAPLKCSLIGFLASGVLPIIGVFCLTSLIGLPTGLFMLGLWGAWVYLSQIITACLIGILVLTFSGAETGRLLLASAIGLLLLSLIGLIPELGVPIQAVSLWLGMGAILQTIFLKRREPIMIAKRLFTPTFKRKDTE
ncbi:MAG: polymer-forming cytoskeletal protein [Pontiellaceae bacterium]